MVVNRHLAVLKALLRADEFEAKVEELFKAFTRQNIVTLPVSVINAQHSIAAADVLDQEWEQGVDLIFDGALNIQLQVDHGYISQSTLVIHTLHDSRVFHLQRCQRSEVAKQTHCSINIDVDCLCIPCVLEHV